MSGTSTAAPVVAGFAAIVRQYLREKRGHLPSAALLKAVIINGTRRLSGADAEADHQGVPNYHQGFGAVHLPTTLPFDASAFRLAFVDNWQLSDQQLTRSGMRKKFNFSTLREGLCASRSLTPTLRAEAFRTP